MPLKPRKIGADTVLEIEEVSIFDETLKNYRPQLRLQPRDMLQVHHDEDNWYKVRVDSSSRYDKRALEVAYILARIDLGRWFPIPWRATIRVPDPWNEQVLLYVIELRVPDRDNGNPITLTRTATISMYEFGSMTSDEVLGRGADFLRYQFIDMLRHEVDEHFKVDGKRVRDPHEGDPR